MSKESFNQLLSCLGSHPDIWYNVQQLLEINSNKVDHFFQYSEPFSLMFIGCI